MKIARVPNQYIETPRCACPCSSLPPLFSKPPLQTTKHQTPSTNIQSVAPYHIPWSSCDFIFHIFYLFLVSYFYSSRLRLCPAVDVLGCLRPRAPGPTSSSWWQGTNFPSLTHGGPASSVRISEHPNSPGLLEATTGVLQIRLSFRRDRPTSFPLRAQ